MSPEELPIHDPTGTHISGQLCDACIEDHGEAAVYCIKCAKKLCKTHEKVIDDHNKLEGIEGPGALGNLWRVTEF